MITSSVNKGLKLSVTGFIVIFLIAAIPALILVHVSLFQEKILRMPAIPLIQAKYSYPLLKRACLITMKPYFDTETEKDSVIQWIDQGADRKPFYQEVYPILERRCIACHGAGMNRADISLIDWADIYELSHERGVPYRKLLNQTHVHLFGLGGLIFILTFLFGLTGYSWPLKLILILLPYTALVLDISGWWLSKSHDLFIYLVWGSGICLYLSLGVISILTIYALWKR